MGAQQWAWYLWFWGCYACVCLKQVTVTEACKNETIVGTPSSFLINGEGKPYGSGLGFFTLSELELKLQYFSSSSFMCHSLSLQGPPSHAFQQTHSQTTGYLKNKFSSWKTNFPLEKQTNKTPQNNPDILYCLYNLIENNIAF